MTESKKEVLTEELPVKRLHPYRHNKLKKDKQSAIRKARKAIRENDTGGIPRWSTLHKIREDFNKAKKANAETLGHAAQLAVAYKSHACSNLVTNALELLNATVAEEAKLDFDDKEGDVEENDLMTFYGYHVHYTTHITPALATIHAASEKISEWSDKLIKEEGDDNE